MKLAVGLLRMARTVIPLDLRKGEKKGFATAHHAGRDPLATGGIHSAILIRRWSDGVETCIRRLLACLMVERAVDMTTWRCDRAGAVGLSIES